MRRPRHKRPAPVRSDDRHALVKRFREYDQIVEVGVGERPDVATALAEYAEVTVTDLSNRTVPDGLSFVRDDVTDPDPSAYAGADLVYSVNLPPELHRPLVSLAEEVDADCAFTTFGTEGPVIPAQAERIGGDTLYWGRRTRSDTG